MVMLCPAVWCRQLAFMVAILKATIGPICTSRVRHSHVDCIPKDAVMWHGEVTIRACCVWHVPRKFRRQSGFAMFEQWAQQLLKAARKKFRPIIESNSSRMYIRGLYRR